MGTYYRYVNHTRKEFVALDELLGGGDKLNAVITCGGALAYLMMAWPSGTYRGRWGAQVVRSAGDCFDLAETRENAQAVGVVSDGQLDFWEMAQPGSAAYEGYVNITRPLREEMIREGVWHYLPSGADHG